MLVQISRVKIWFAKILEDFGALCIFWLYIGTNTDDNAPSPRMRLKRLGNFKETLRQSAAAPDPKT